MHQRRSKSLLLAAVVLSACTDSEPPAETTAVPAGTEPSSPAGSAVVSPQPVPPRDNTEPRTTGVHWSYGGRSAPQYWGQISPAYTLCARGKNQSPIDISTVTISNLPPLSFDYHETGLMVVNNGLTLVATPQRANHVLFGDRRFRLTELHFHAPGEHSLGGRIFPMSIHFVHAHPDEGPLIIALFLTPGKSNPELAKIWRELTLEKDQRSATPVSVSLPDIVPETTAYYHYQGSLTTPPCTEGVSWLVLAEPQTISEQQRDQWQRRFVDNARYRQPLNGRVVWRSN